VGLVEVGVVGISDVVVTVVGDSGGVVSVVLTVDVEFSVVGSIAFGEKAASWTQRIVSVGVDGSNVGIGIDSGRDEGFPRTELLITGPAIAPTTNTGSPSKVIHRRINFRSASDRKVFEFGRGLLLWEVGDTACLGSRSTSFLSALFHKCTSIF
jgi:hypothetical protein